MERRLQAAEGYLELGMPEEARLELEAVPVSERGRSEVLILEVAAASVLKDWEAMALHARTLVERDPGESGFWVNWAYATRRAVSLEVAHRILLDALERHPQDPLIHFNLGCYACQLGDLGLALERLREAVALDGTYRKLFEVDSDLTALREAIRAGELPAL